MEQDHEERLEAIRFIVQSAQMFAEQMVRYMDQQGIKPKGSPKTDLFVSVYPSMGQCFVNFGDINNDDYFVMRTMTIHDKDGWLTPGLDGKRARGINPNEYERLFDRSVRQDSGRTVQKGEKELPPDGLWLSDYSNHSPMDCGV